MGSDYKRQVVSQPILGIVRNIAPENIDPRAFVTAHNIVFRNGQVEKVTGWVPASQNASGSVNFIKSVDVGNTALTAFVGTNTNMYQYAKTGLNKMNTALFTMEPTSRWDADYLAGKWYFTNKQDGAWAWDQFNPMITLGPSGMGIAGLGNNNKAQNITQFQNHLLLGNIASGDQQGTFTVASSSLLGETGVDFLTTQVDGNGNPVQTDAVVFQLQDEASGIQAMRRLLNQLVIYKRTSIYLLNYQGGALVYNLAEQVTNRGLTAPASLVDLGDRHVFIGSDNLYQFNGSTPQAFGDRVWQFLNNDIEPHLGVSSVWAFWDPRNREIVFGYVQNGSNSFNKALVWNYQYDAFSTRDFPFSAAGLTMTAFGDPPISQLVVLPDGTQQNPIGSAAFPFGFSAGSLQNYALLAGDQAGGLFILDDSFNTSSAALQANGKDIPATLETGDMNFGGQERYKIVAGLDFDCPVLTGSPLQVYVAARKTLGDPIVWSEPYLYTKAWRGVNFTSANANNVWFRFKFVKPDGAWTLRGYAPRYQMLGWY